jgi:DmsE family decaheme c-type cytochrome
LDIKPGQLPIAICRSLTSALGNLLANHAAGYGRKMLGALAWCALVGGVGLSASALAQDKAVDRTLKGDAVCTKCHDQSWDKPILALYATRMGVKGDPRTPGCQSCHGASAGHLQNPGNAPDVVFDPKSAKVSSTEQRNANCLSCHQSGKRTLWMGSKHQSEDIACVNCHQVHSKDGDKVLAKATQRQVCFACHQTIRAETMRISTHPIEAGKVACSDCHNPHGSDGPKLMAEKSVRDTCFTCHADKRGPFLWEHPPASDDCMNCHTPHGSTTAPLLTTRQPWLCQQCHGDGAPHPGNIYSAASLPGGAVANINTQNPVLNGAAGINPITGKGVALNNPPPQLAFRSCTNCHVYIHGSSSIGGERFTR